MEFSGPSFLPGTFMIPSSKLDILKAWVLSKISADAYACYHRITPDAHVKPAPKAANKTIEPC